MKPSLYFHENLILRTPRLPFSAAPDQETLVRCLADDAFMDAIYLASPALFRQCRLYQQGDVTDSKKVEKLFQSLGKYYLRMSSRSTPFGLFSGCSVVTWGAAGQPIVLGQDVRRTRFDMKFLCDLARTLALVPEVQVGLTYFPNSSLYQIGDEWRYAECSYIYGLRNYQLTSVSDSPYLALVLRAARAGASLTSLTQQLTASGIEAAAAAGFIQQLLEAQLLVSNLEPQVTGPEFVQQILRILTETQAAHPSARVADLLTDINALLALVAELDVAPAARCHELYAAIVERVKAFGIVFHENQLFQTDVARTVVAGAVPATVQQELLEAVDVLGHLCPPNSRRSLQQFATRFAARYDTQEVPLAEVLDPEVGIGYGDNKNAHVAPLISELSVAPATASAPTIVWNAHQRWMFGKLQQAHRRQDYSVAITAADVQSLPRGLDSFPTSTSVTFRLLAHEQLSLQLDGVGGSSAANMLGRFAHANPQISQTIVDITAAEYALNPEVVFCEVVHLPDSRVGNILLHPCYHTYEIPFLSQSSRPLEQQLALDDILVSVLDGHITLRSKKLNKVIIPRQTSAHNHTYKTLSTYQFLCDIQNQNLRTGNYFNWGSLAEEFTFLPRLTFKNTVLYPASWQFKATDFEALTPADAAQATAALATFRAQWQLPRYVVLAEGDNELLIDWENAPAVQILLATIKGRAQVVLREYLVPAAESLVTNQAGAVFCNQFVASLLHRQPVYQPKESARFVAAARTQRAFGIGSEWLYYKLYCGLRSADKMLATVIGPVVEQLTRENLIDQWFFMRFNDPEVHIRVRFHVLNPEVNAPRVAQLLRTVLEGPELSKFVWKIQSDPYSRELERYGSQNIEHCESYFHHDSAAFLAFYRSATGFEKENLRWLYTTKSIDSLLQDFGYSLAEKHRILGHLAEGYSQMYQVTKPVKMQLDKAYREHRPAVANLFSHAALFKGYDTQEFDRILARRSAATAPLLAALRHTNTDAQLLSLLSSLIHMIVNRATSTNTGTHELVIYTYLHRYYQSLLALEKKSLAPAATPTHR